ncbi:MAG: cadherin repeat domain-containing protein [Planctomycetota bacterium]
MNQRERYLSIAVGGLVLAIVFQWGFGRYRSAIRMRNNRLASLQNETQVLEERRIQGAYADRQMGEYLSRSLPSDPEQARSSYQAWLLDTAAGEGLRDAIVDPISEVPVGDLYRRFGYRVAGQTSMEGLLDLLYRIHARDTLHRIRELNFGPDRNGDISVEMAIDSIALNAAAPDAQAPSDTPSYRIADDWEAMRLRILDRNFFQPPNQAPRYTGPSRLVATRGRPEQISLSFSDPERHAMRFAVDSELPDWVTFDPRGGRLRMSPPTDLQLDDPVQLTVRVSDQGYPNREMTQTLTLSVVDPKVEPPPVAPPRFDDASQTYLTGLLDGREPVAWMKVRTKGETLKLRIGDSFEIGTVKGKVVGINSRTAELEIEGQRYQFRQAEKLSDVLRAGND